MSIQAPWKNLLVDPLIGDHFVQVYRDERALADAVALFASSGLGKGEAVILVATPAHVEAVEQRLEAASFCVEGLKRWGQLIVVDAASLLSQFMLDGVPDARLFEALAADLIKKARADGRYRKVRAYGEMVNLLWGQNLVAAARLEQLWNDVIQAHSISLFCAYHIVRRPLEAWPELPHALRDAHSHLIPLDASA